MADVADDGVVLHLGHVLGGNNVVAAGGRDEDVCFRDYVFHSSNLIAVHGSLQRTNWIDFSDNYARTLATK